MDSTHPMISTMKGGAWKMTLAAQSQAQMTRHPAVTQAIECACSFLSWKVNVSCWTAYLIVMPLRNVRLPELLHSYFVTTAPNSIFYRQGYQWRRISLLNIHPKLLSRPWRCSLVPRLQLVVLLLVNFWWYDRKKVRREGISGGDPSRKDKGSIYDGGQAWINQVKELKVLFNYEFVYCSHCISAPVEYMRVCFFWLWFLYLRK